MRAYELAARMQLAVPDVTAVWTESQSTRDLYGLDREECLDFGRRCLLARRLVERGVRFVQLFSGGAFGSPRINWDGTRIWCDGRRRLPGGQGSGALERFPRYGAAPDGDRPRAPDLLPQWD